MSITYDEKSQPHLVPIDTVDEYPDNPRRGDTKALRESILTNGFYGVLIAQRSTGFILAGNHRLRVLRELGAKDVPVMFIDCSDSDARRIVLADNRTSDLAFYDDPTLFKLLQELDGDLSGTGYDRASYELLLQGLEGEQILGGIAQGFSPEEREAAYIDSEVRSIILPYSGEAYDDVAENLQALRSALSLDTNADVVEVLARVAVCNIDWFTGEVRTDTY
jgi:hypothetical protein